MQSDQMRHFNRIAKQYQSHCGDILIEKHRYEIINKKLFKNFKNIHSFKANLKEDSCVNFPILVKNKGKFVKKLIKNNIDLSPHYYRNCATLKVFKKWSDF